MRCSLSFRLSGPALLAAVALLVAGCGDSRTSEPGLSQPVAPVAFRVAHFPTAGITLQIPRAWVLVPGNGALVTTVSSGTAIVAVWRYPASAPPAGTRALAAARRSLVKQAIARDARFKLIGSRVTEIDGAPAVEINALEHIDGRVRRVRSVHAFRHHAQVVLEEYAPPDIFAAEDQSVFSRLQGSLVLTPMTSA